MLWIGSPHRILVASEDARLILYTSPALLQELAGVLDRPKFASRLRDLHASAAELTAGYARLARLVTPQRVMRVVMEDPADDEVLACALGARANYIVSGDSISFGCGLTSGFQFSHPPPLFSRSSPSHNDPFRTSRDRQNRACHTSP